MLLSFFVIVNMKSSKEDLLLSAYSHDSHKHVRLPDYDGSLSTVNPTSPFRSKHVPLNASEIVVQVNTKIPDFRKEMRYPSSNSVALVNRNYTIDEYNLSHDSPTFDKKVNTLELPNNDYGDDSFSDVLLDGCRKFEMPQNQYNNCNIFSEQPYLHDDIFSPQQYLLPKKVNEENSKSKIKEQVEESEIESTDEFELRKAYSF